MTENLGDPGSFRVGTARLTLRNWREADRDAFARLQTDPEVMADLGGPFDRARSDAKFDRYTAAFRGSGFTRWALEGPGKEFLGYCGLMPHGAEHPLGPHADIGWRLSRSAWGHGYASEAARAALGDAFSRVGLKEVFAYTSPDNLRSQAVMDRLNLNRDPSRDFVLRSGDVTWQGLVWIAGRKPFKAD